MKKKSCTEGCPPHRQKVLAGKNLKLFAEMLKEIKHPDRELVRDIAAGFPITGKLPRSGVFPPRRQEDIV